MTACRVLEDVKSRGCRLWVDWALRIFRTGTRALLFGYVDTLFVNERVE